MPSNSGFQGSRPQHVIKFMTSNLVSLLSFSFQPHEGTIYKAFCRFVGPLVTTCRFPRILLSFVQITRLFTFMNLLCVSTNEFVNSKFDNALLKFR